LHFLRISSHHAQRIMSDEKDDEKKMDIDEAETPESEDRPQDILLKAAELSSRFTLLRAANPTENKAETDRLLEELMAIYGEHQMIEFYRDLCTKNEMIADDGLISKWEKKRDELLAANASAKELAEKNEGDVEVHEIELKRAAILAKTGDLEDAIDAFLEIGGLTTGKQIDKYLTILRLCLAWNDDHFYKKHMAEASRLIEKGGDWDRRNRFTVYSAAHFFRIRKFKESAEGLLGSIATFSATEIFDYERLVKYVILSAVLTLDRKTMKKKVIGSPEIMQVIDKLPVFRSFLYSFFECRYQEVFESLIEIMRHFVRHDVYLNEHANFFLRGVRLRAYSQFLESYRSVTLASMAKEFGVGIDFLDGELASYIAAGKLNCKIDRVGGIVHIERTHSKNRDYQRILKQGDVLLNRIQRLSRIITY